MADTMNEQAIYYKTAKGQDEITTRRNQLSARLRSQLVMVDGRCSGAVLLAKSKSLGDAAALLEQLIAEGFIEAAAIPTVASPAAAAPDTALPAVIQLACHQLIDKLGPSADALTGRLEACRTRDELVATLEKCREAIRAIAGRSKAEEFWSTVTEKLGEP
jgi:hypothetical protein